MVPADDILAPKARHQTPRLEARRGLWVEHRGSGFVGIVEDVERRAVWLRDDAGLLRSFGLDERGYLLIASGEVVTLVAPSAAPPQAPAVTASGAVAAPRGPARVARPDRILVEGTHDAELLEKVWGDELRAEAIVVEPIGGADNLAAALRERAPAPDARIGVLLDHLVPGSKESRIAQDLAHPWVLVAGHPYVDVWQTIRPHVAGLDAWPVVPRGVEWKEGICAALGVADPAHLWRQLLGSVDTFRDLEPALVGAVERLLDFLLGDEA